MTESGDHLTAQTSVISRVLSCLERGPDKAALTLGGHSFTYAELLAHAAATSALLQGWKGERAAPLTAILGRRSLTAYSGVLAALLRGHGYVPLSPLLPVERLLQILDRTGAAELLVDNAGMELLPQLLSKTERPLFVVVPSEEAAARVRREWPRHTAAVQLSVPEARGSFGGSITAPAAHPDSPAYVLFTSGSTGLPKAVPVAQRNLSHFIDAVVRRYGLGPADRFSQTFEMTFDVSVFDLLGSWSSGACLCAPADVELNDPGKYVRDSALTVWFSVPSLAKRLEVGPRSPESGLASLRLCIFAGEPLPVSLAERWHAVAPQARIENAYGPTEATIFCTAYEWAADESRAKSERGIVSIGTPLPAMTTLIVDAQLKPLPAGVEGELLVSGPLVTPGYLDDPDRTRAAFIVPVGQPAVFYRTGDKVRQIDEQGNLVYLGRVDDQIKVGGHRIELGEVEAALREAAKVQTAVALGWPDTDVGYDGIVAFIDDPQADLGVVRQGLAARLPSYMIPHQILFVDSFPTTLSGKVDRQALRFLLARGSTRRQHARCSRRLRVDFVDQGTTRSGHSIELSSRGLALEVEAGVRDQELLCRVYLEDAQPTALRYMVRRQRQGSVALQLSPGQEEGLAPIHRYLQARLVEIVATDESIASASAADLIFAASYQTEIGLVDEAVETHRRRRRLSPDDPPVFAEEAAFCLLRRVRDLGKSGWPLVTELKRLLAQEEGRGANHLLRLVREQLDSFTPSIDRRQEDGDRRGADDLELCLTSIWSEIVGRVTVGVSDSFLTLGADSLGVATFAEKLRGRFGVSPPVASIYAYPNARAFARFLRENYPEIADGLRVKPGRAPRSDVAVRVTTSLGLLVPLKPDGAKRPLFMLPELSGGPHVYQHLARQFEADRPLVAFESPDRRWKHDVLSIRRQAELFVTVIRSVQPTGPYLLGGWSSGASVAFEAALRLEADGEEVSRLVLIDPMLRSASSMFWFRTWRSLFHLLAGSSYGLRLLSLLFPNAGRRLWLSFGHGPSSMGELRRLTCAVSGGALTRRALSSWSYEQLLDEIGVRIGLPAAPTADAANAVRTHIVWGKHMVEECGFYRPVGLAAAARALVIASSGDPSKCSRWQRQFAQALDLREYPFVDLGPGVHASQMHPENVALFAGDLARFLS